MSENQVAIRDTSADIMERVIAVGDLAKLTPTERNAYYLATCKSLGLNPLTRPFEYIRLNNRLVLYARRDCTDQLRKRDRISVEITSRELTADLYSVTCKAINGDGRVDESLGVVSVKGKTGDDLANALMKAETKSKRRVTLSIVGLGWLDETEIETISDRQIVTVNAQTGEIEEPEEAALWWQDKRTMAQLERVMWDYAQAYKLEGFPVADTPAVIHEVWEVVLETEKPGAFATPTEALETMAAGFDKLLADSYGVEYDMAQIVAYTEQHRYPRGSADIQKRANLIRGWFDRERALAEAREADEEEGEF